MKKKVLTIITTIILIMVMAFPAMAGSGDNTGDDIFLGWNVSIVNSSLYGDYTIGTEKVFRVDTWAGNNKIENVTREIKITGEDGALDFEFKDDESQWKSVSEYNIVVNELKRDVGREFRVTFNKAGKYSIEYNIYNAAGEVVLFSKRNIAVAETGIDNYVESDTTTPDATTPGDATIPDATTPGTSVPVITTPESVTPECTQPQSSTADANLTTQAPTKENIVKVGKTKVKKASKSKNSKKAKISLKKIKGAKKYQVQISVSKKFKKVLVKKTVKKVKFTISSKKIKNKKKLYVRAKAIKVVNGINYYGKWSKAKRIIIK